MDHSNIKDAVILTLVDTIAELYHINYNIDSELVKSNIINKLTDFNIIENNTDLTILKNKILKIMNKDMVLKLKPSNTLSIFDNFSNIELIGQNYNSFIYKAYYPLDENTYAIKKIGYDNISFQLLQEARSLAKLNHPNIVRYFNSWLESKSSRQKLQLTDNNLLENIKEVPEDETIGKNYNKFLFIQMELCKCNLKEFLKKNSITLIQKLIIIRQIIYGLQYLHSMYFIHRDIKLSNIFISLDNKVKLGDFGFSTKSFDNNNEDLGTFGYIAPEILAGENYDYRVDLYSLGIVILEICCNFNTQMEKYETIKNIDKFNNPHEGLEKIIKGLIKKNPEDRLSLTDCIKLID